MSKNILLITLIPLILSLSPYPIENDVLVLNEQNFGLALREFKYLLVLFYDPECPHCINFMPEFERTASIVKKESFVLAKLDAIKGEKVGNHYNLEAFPTVKLLIKGENITYEGERKAEEIEKWLKEQTKPDFKKIKTKEELEKIKKNNKVFLVYFGNDKKVIDELIIADRSIDDIPIYLIDSDELTKENVNLENNERLAIFKKFDEKKSIFNDTLTSKNIINFVNIYSYPKVIEFNDDTSYLIFLKRNPSLVIFDSKEDEGYKKNLQLLNKLWPKVNGKLKLFVCNIKDVMSITLAKYCFITPLNIPKVFIVHAKTENPKKYEMEEEINEENILKFIDNWAKGEIEPFIRSEPIPIKNDGDLLKLVGKNFKKEVFKDDKDVLIYFTSPKCRVCKDFISKLEKLAKKLKKNNPKLLIAQMDASINDIEDYVIHTFPTIKFYPGNAKDKEPLNFYTRKNITSLLNFVKKNAYHKIIDDDENKKTTDL